MSDTQTAAPATEPVLVQKGDLWDAKHFHSIARSAPALDAAKLAKARADSERVAALMGWN